MYSFSPIARADRSERSPSGPLTEPVRTEAGVRTTRPRSDLLLAGEDPTLELAWPQDATEDLDESTPKTTKGPIASAAPAGQVGESKEPVSPSIAAATAYDQGQVLYGRYKLERAMAVGGSSIVYCATDLRAETDASLPATVAIKIIRPDMRQRSSMNERLKREFGYTASLHHPNIVRVFELDTHDEIPFFSMEYLSGEPLNSRLQRQAPQTFAPPEALRILQACGAALAYAHERGVLHCDFKPSNVLLTEKGVVKVLDFGAACAFTSDLGANVKKPESATPAYASPQLLAAERPDVRDDVFSLACVAYELFSGRHPFGGLSAVEMFSRGKALVRPDSLPDTRWQAIESALRIERDARPPSVAAFLSAFTAPQPVIHELEPIAGSQSLIPQSLVSHSKSPRGRILAAALLIALGIAIGNRWHSEHHSTPPVAVKATQASSDISGIQQSISRYRTAVPSARVIDTFQPLPSLLSAFGDARSLAFATTRRLATSGATSPAVSRAANKPKALADGMVTLEQSRLEVSRHSIAAVLTLRRTGTPNGRVSVQWRTQGGTARPSQDYESIEDGVVSLAAGQSTRALFIPLKQQRIQEGARSFTVEIKDAKGAELGGITRAVVTIR